VADLPSTIGRYEIVSRLGQGGMGSLYLARDPKIGRLVAIKLVRQEFDSPEARQRFAREAQAAGTLRHPNIVTIFDVDEHGGLPFIAMEYVEGETVSEIVRRKGRYPLATKLRWMEELCAGLAYAHRQGVVHRDVKPSNLMVDGEGSLKILDFGLARREASKFTQSQAIIGTPNYMSPEQIRAEGIGPPSDIFAVGAVLYEIVTGVEAFPGTVHQAMHRILFDEPRPIRALVPDVDPALEAILARALDKDPSRRYDDLGAMRGELAQVREHAERTAPELTETVALTPSGRSPRPAGPSPQVPGSGSPGTPRSGGRGSLRDSAHRLTLQRRRATQIEAHLVDARRFCESGEFDKARQAIDEALMIDPDHLPSVQLFDDIASEEERRRIAQAVASARAALEQGRVESAAQIAAAALEQTPHASELLQLRDMIETARREIERARQVQEILRRARTRFSDGSFEGALRAVGELLAIDPHNAAARELQARAQQAIDDRARRADHDKGAQAAVAHARELFDHGDHAGAIALLEAFRPPHELVSGVLASLRGASLPAVSLPPPAPAASAPPPASRAVARDATRRLVFAASALLVLGLGGFVSYRQFFARPPFPSAAPAATTPAPAPTVTIPSSAAPPPGVAAPATPPSSLASRPPQNDNDRDALDAYRLLAAGQSADAEKIVARIARRDPANEHLADLRAQLQRVAADRGQTGVRPGSSASAASPLRRDEDQGQTPSSLRDSGHAGTPPAALRVEPGIVLPPPTQPAQPVGVAEPAPAPERTGAPDRPAADVERPAIEAVIAEYARALSNKDLPAVARVRRYTPIEARNWQNAFKQFTEYRLIVKVTGPPVLLNGDRARVPVEEQFAETAKRGGIQVFSQPRSTEYLLEKIGGKWMILPPG